MDSAFEVHKLNETGISKAREIAFNFDNLFTVLKDYVPTGRELAIVRTHLEDACFYAKKGMANQPENQHQL